MYKKLKIEQVPTRERKSESRFESTREWKLMREDLDRGLAVQEASQVILTPEDKESMGIKNRRSIARFVKKYIQTLGPKGKGLQVKSFQRDGNDYIIVQHTPVLRAGRSAESKKA